MKRFKNLALGLSLVGITALTGCTSLHMSQPTSPLNVGTVALIGADIEVGEKISGTASSTIIFNFIELGGTKFADGVSYNAGGGAVSSPISDILGAAFGAGKVEGVKAAAAYDAVTKANADVLVAPKYIIDLNDMFVFKTINVTVSGYKGTVKGFKQLDPTKR